MGLQYGIRKLDKGKDAYIHQGGAVEFSDRVTGPNRDTATP